jgi:hypothetical protein
VRLPTLSQRVKQTDMLLHSLGRTTQPEGPRPAVQTAIILAVLHDRFFGSVYGVCFRPPVGRRNCKVYPTMAAGDGCAIHTA